MLYFEAPYEGLLSTRSVVLWTRNSQTIQFRILHGKLFVIHMFKNIIPNDSSYISIIQFSKYTLKIAFILHQTSFRPLTLKPSPSSPSHQSDYFLSPPRLPSSSSSHAAYPPTSPPHAPPSPTPTTPSTRLTPSA